jgi:DNA-entry nuclease
VKLNRKITALLLVLALFLSGCSVTIERGGETTAPTTSDTAQQGDTTGGQSGEETYSTSSDVITLDNLPPYSGEAYIALNDNVPEFEEGDMTTTSFESYSDLDSLGRCGVAFANVGVDLMPTEERGSISQVKPSGWQSVKYDCVDGKYLYNRCHLIGFQLTGENANKKNLITGTRYLNIDGMLLFENMVADYVKETENHVLYRVTPIFEGDDLVAQGVQMEGYSVEDEGDSISFNVFCYNVQPGVTIDYATGESQLADTTDAEVTEAGAEETYVLNTKGKKFHLPDCSVVSNMSADNREDYTGTREDLTSQGYEPCGKCKP